VDDGDRGPRKCIPGFSFAIAGSFQAAILPRKMSAIVSPSSFKPLLMFGRL
jgi:hypothetical protein